MEGSMKKAWLLISDRLLIDALHLPSNVEIIDAKIDEDYPPGHVIKLLITHPDLPECVPDEEPLNVNAILHRQESIVFDGWRWVDDGKS